MVTNAVLTVAGAKGGVGKTTTTINLAAALATDGLSTVAVEMDLPMPNFADFLEFDRPTAPRPTLTNVLAGDADVLAAVHETASGFDAIPSASTIEDYDGVEIERFPQLVDELRWHYDVVLVDTPAGITDETRGALAAGDAALIVSTPRLASLQNARRTIELARAQDTAVRGFVLNKSGSGASPGIDAIEEEFDVPALGHVPEDSAVPHAQDHGRPVVVHSRRSGPAIAYRRLADTVLDGENHAAGSDDGEPTAGEEHERNGPAEDAPAEPTPAVETASGSAGEAKPDATTSAHSDDTGAESTGRGDDETAAGTEAPDDTTEVETDTEGEEAAVDDEADTPADEAAANGDEVTVAEDRESGVENGESGVEDADTRDGLSDRIRSLF